MRRKKMNKKWKIYVVKKIFGPKKHVAKNFGKKDM